MKIQNGIVALLLLATGFTAGAQGTNTSYAEGAFHENTWFVGGGLGLNVGFDGEKYQSRSESHSGAGWALDAYAGYWVVENLAFRAGLRGITISDQYTNFAKYKNLYLHGDVLFKVGNGFVPYLHAGYAHINKGSLAGGAGLMFPIHLSRRVAVIPDVSVAALSGRAFNNETGSVGLSTSATLGVYVSLGADRKHRDPERWEAVETIGGTVWRLKPASEDEDLAMLQGPAEEETVKVRPEKPKKEKPVREKPMKEKPVKEKPAKPQKDNEVQEEKPARNEITAPVNPVAQPSGISVYYPQGTTASAHGAEALYPVRDSNSPVILTPVGQSVVSSAESALVETRQGAAPCKPCPRVVYFEYDLSDISDLASGMLDKLAAEMEVKPELNILVIGHTDDRGSEEYNERLSIERAEAVKAYLVEQGISGKRIETQGIGAAEPAASNDNDGGRALNRRAVIINQEK